MALSAPPPVEPADPRRGVSALATLELEFELESRGLGFVGELGMASRETDRREARSAATRASALRRASSEGDSPMRRKSRRAIDAD